MSRERGNYKQDILYEKKYLFSKERDKGKETAEKIDNEVLLHICKNKSLYLLERHIAPNKIGLGDPGPSVL